MNRSTFFILLLIAQFSLISMASVKKHKSSQIVAKKSTIYSHDKLKNGDSLYSPNGMYRLTQEWSGNLKVYSMAYLNGRYEKEDHQLWTSKTGDGGMAPYVLKMQPDGNLVTYDTQGKPYWDSKTNGKGKGPYRVTIQDDGNCVLYDSKNQALWSTGTHGQK